MRASRKTVTWTGTLLVLILVGAGCHTATPDSHAHPDTSTVLVLAPNKDASLDLVPAQAFQAGSDESLAVDASPTAGASRTVARIQGTPALATAAFTGTAAKDYYLDLAQPVSGTVYVSNALNSGPRAAESGKFQVELYVDGAFGGGAQFEHNAASASAKWNPVPVYFQPEVRHIPAGSAVELRISSISSLLDFQVGTGGAMQSEVRIAFYPFDPLAGAVFLEKGKLVTSLSDDNDTAEPEAVRVFVEDPAFDDLPPGLYIVRDPEEARGLHVALLLPAALLGLLGFAGRSPRRVLAVALVAMVTLAGCAGDAGPEQDTGDDEGGFQPKVNSTFEDNKGEDADKQKEANVGSVEGIVKDHVGIPIAGAHVSLLATNKFAATAEDGKFLIKDVPAGAYTMRVDAEGMDSLEQAIEVQVAKTTRLTIQLAPPAGTQGDALAHHHDDWGGKERIKWMDPAVVSPDKTWITTTSAGTPGLTACFQHRGTYATEDHGAPTPNCLAEVPIDFSKPVVPGTGTLEVRLDWDVGGVMAPQVLGVAYTNGHRGLPEHQLYLPRAPGEPFFIQFFPNEADPGHQKFTNWQLYVVTEQADAYSPWEMPSVIPDITVETYLHKSVVPFEPRHQSKWGEVDRFVLADGGTRHTFTCACTPGSGTSVGEEDGGWWSSVSDFWQPLKGTWVPAGTSHIEGTLRAAPYQVSGVSVPAPSYVEYGLAYKPAAVPVGHALGNLVVVEDMKEVDGNYEFTIRPTADHLDQWYQSSTNWRFYLLVKSDVHPYSNHGFTLEATAHKDPTWEPPA